MIGVIFDSDGVVVDSEDASMAAFVEAVSKFGIDLSNGDMRESFGVTDSELIDRINQKYIGAIDFRKFKKEKIELYRYYAKKKGIKVFPGVRELLQYLKSRDIPHALASSGSIEKIRFNLSITKLNNEFKYIVSSEDVKRGKPDPEIFLLAAKKIAVLPHNCIVIEDSPNGIKAAKAADMLCIAVTNTFESSELAPADYKVKNLFEVPGILEDIIDRKNIIS